MPRSYFEFLIPVKVFLICCFIGENIPYYAIVVNLQISINFAVSLDKFTAGSNRRGENERGKQNDDDDRRVVLVLFFLFFFASFFSSSYHVTIFFYHNLVGPAWWR